LSWSSTLSRFNDNDGSDDSSDHEDDNGGGGGGGDCRRGDCGRAGRGGDRDRDRLILLIDEPVDNGLSIGDNDHVDLLGWVAGDGHDGVKDTSPSENGEFGRDGCPVAYDLSLLDLVGCVLWSLPRPVPCPVGKRPSLRPA